MKRRSIRTAVLSLVLVLSLLTAPALADKGKEPQGKGKQQTEQRDSGFDVSRLARVTAIGGAVGAVIGGTIAAVRGRRRNGKGRAAKAAPVHGGYYRPAGKGERCGRMPEPWAAESVPESAAPEAFAWPEESASPWPESPAAETPPAPMEEPAPVHPSLGENPFAAFEEFFGGDSSAEEYPELPEEEAEEPEDEEPGEVNFKI